jgi:hypothetical protein
VPVADGPIGEGDETGGVSVQPADKKRITRSNNKQSGMQRFMSGSITILRDMCCDCGVKQKNNKKTLMNPFSITPTL